MPDFWTGAGSGALSGGLGIIGSLVSYGLNKRLAEQQNQYNIDMWKMQADYNSPQSQMQRFSKAGLNPNLVYGQGSAGNMSQAPQMVTPQAPELSEPMRRLGEAFNIENLRTTIANRKKAQADALNAQTNAERNAWQLFAEKRFGSDYYFNPTTGSFVSYPADKLGEVTVRHASNYYYQKLLENNYFRTHLIPLREALLHHQAQYLAPQIEMLKYDNKYYPWTFWINNVSRGIHGASELISNFLPTKWAIPTKLNRPPIRYQPINNFR